MKSEDVHTEELEVVCAALAHGGAMVCNVIGGVAEQVGKKAFVRGLAPGEKASIRVIEDKRSFLVVEVARIMEPSPVRVVPPCPVFGECGGCDLQYLPIALQRELKRDMVEKTLIRQGRLNLPKPVELFGADLPAFHYRRRIALHLDKNGNLGFFREGTGDVVPFRECLIASEQINRVLSQLIRIASEVASEVGGVTIEEFLSHAVPLLHLREGVSEEVAERLQVRLSSEFALGKVYSDGEQLIEWHDGLSQSDAIEFSTLNHFSQINEEGNQLLIEKVLESLKDSAEITEFYAGSGNFTLPLGRAGKLVDAIEVDEKLVAHGREVVRIEDLRKVTFVASSTERYLQHSLNTVRHAVLLDPPRSGARALAERLSPKRVKKIVYVSCALPTLTRDLSILVTKGYRIVQSGIIDMFPHTHHVESVTVLEGEV